MRSACGYGKRPEQDGIDDAKDGGVSADAERQGQDGDGGEGWLFRQHPQGITKILEKGVHGTTRCAMQQPDRPRWRVEPATSRR